MEITAAQVKTLREKTGAGMMDCKTALAASGGEMEGAIKHLREKGLATAAKRAGKVAAEGMVASRLVSPSEGLLLELNCETDFVARNDDFKALVRNLGMHIAAANPLYVTRDQVPEADLAAERDIASAQVAGKPPAAVQKIVEGKIEKFYAGVVLLDQPYVKEPEKSIKEILTEAIAKTGENIQVRRFIRYQLGS